MRILTKFSIALSALCFASAASALPPIVIMNYTPPPPAFLLVSMQPTDHQAFDKPPTTVSAGFSQMVDDAGSDIKVYDPYNNVVANRGPSARGSTLDASLPAKMLSGTYRIDWKATCACPGKGVIKGTSYFTVY